MRTQKCCVSLFVLLACLIVAGLSPVAASADPTWQFNWASVLPHNLTKVNGPCDVQLYFRVSTPTGLQNAIVLYTEEPGCTQAATIAETVLTSSEPLVVSADGSLFFDAFGSTAFLLGESVVAVDQLALKSNGDQYLWAGYITDKTVHIQATKTIVFLTINGSHSGSSTGQLRCPMQIFGQPLRAIDIACNAVTVGTWITPVVEEHTGALGTYFEVDHFSGAL